MFGDAVRTVHGSISTNVAAGRSARLRLLGLACVTALATGLGGTLSSAWAADRPAAAPARYEVQTIGKPLRMHGLQGLTVGPDGALYVCSVSGGEIYRVDKATGEVGVFVGHPHGGADDIAFAPDGTAVWANYLEGAVYARSKDGEVRLVARDLPGVDGIAFSRDGRLFVSNVPPGDGLYELDLSGKTPPRVVVAKAGVLNAFAEGADGKMYGPVIAASKIAKFDLTTGSATDVVDGFQLPISARFDAAGRLYVAEYAKGEIYRIDLATKEKALVATLAAPLDNFIIDKDGTIYATSTAFNGVTAVNPDTKVERRITWGQLSAPGMLTVIDDNGAERLLVADAWGPRILDPVTGEAVLIKNDYGTPGSAAIVQKGSAYVISSNELYGAGVVQQRDVATGRVLATPGHFDDVYDVKALPDGVLVADFAGGRLVKLADDAAHTKTEMPWSLEGPVGLADAGQGRFYVSEYTGGRISLVDTQGRGAKSVVVEGLDHPEGVALAGDGRLLVAEVGKKRLIAVDPKSGKTTVLADNLAIGREGVPHAPAPFLPTGVAVGRDGAIYVTSDIDNVVYRLKPEAS